jgi:site-specific DNA-methyltransferase (adenine-specific)
MPSLGWPGKGQQRIEAAALVPDSIVYPGGHGYPSAAIEDRLYLGDNLAIMAALLPEYERRFDLIYADPPFFTNRKFAARIGRGEDSRRPADWALAEGYGDSWPDLDAYLDFLYQRLVLMHRLLKPTGTFYLHLDWHADAYARVLLDEIFGPQHLLNEIIWVYHGPSPIRTAFNRKHDTILSYGKGPAHTFNADAVRQPYNPSTVQTFQASPKAGFGKMPDLERGKVPEDWWYFPVVARLHRERTGYPTQKPEALLERMILASSSEGELIGDFFCGSGTTAVVASRLGRHFIACDTSFRAIHVTRRRLCAVGSPPFVVERQDSSSFPLASAHAVDVNTGSGAVSLKDLPDIEYWEVDPHWDGKVFRSAAQAVRSSAAAPLPLELGIKTGRRLCVRVVTASGELLQQPLDIEPVSNPADRF